MPYNCAFGHTSYDPSCDACDSEVSDQTTGWAESSEDTEDRFRGALRGQSMQEYREEMERTRDMWEW